ncbi:MAG: hypothetical protein ACKVP2_16495 [Burkholderiales bacterium]
MASTTCGLEQLLAIGAMSNPLRRRQWGSTPLPYQAPDFRVMGAGGW